VGDEQVIVKLRWLLAVLISLMSVTGATFVTSAATHPAVVKLSGIKWPKTAASGPPAPSGGVRNTLILVDDTTKLAKLAQSYGVLASNLVSHFTHPVTQAVTSYKAGQIRDYTALVYIGVVADQELPRALLDDVLADVRPTLWLGGNVDELARTTAFATRYGWKPGQPVDPVTTVTYKGARLTRPPDAEALTRISITASSAQVLATATSTSGEVVPWAVRSRQLTYVAEPGLDSGGVSSDRYLATSDLLFDLLSPTVPTRHRALLRLEDIGPDAVPEQLKTVAEYLAAQHIPYSFALYPIYVDPVDRHPRRTIKLAERPEVVKVIAYMLQHGGTMVLHGLTHQLGDRINPVNGGSGADFEFYQVHKSPGGTLIYDGPAPGDSPQWAHDRIVTAITEVTRTGLPRPEIFEFPHYGASLVDYGVVADLFEARYDRVQMPMDSSPYMFAQYLPYVIHDVYGSTVIPENLGYLCGPPVQTTGSESIASVIENAQKQLVVRDGIASFFYHPYLGIAGLKEILDSLSGMGYSFTAPADL
jgi:uncharacterized protein YdaL